MNGKIIAGIVVLCLGVVIVAILCGLGGYAKQAVRDGVLSRLEYELPKGYEKDPNFEQCYKSVKAAFDEEYYMWNLTNLADVLAGGKANFNLTGPFAYTESYCEYDHKIDEAAGILTFRRYTNGYHFIPPAGNAYPQTDDLLITNINPAYLGLLAGLGGDDSYIGIRVAVLGPALLKVITGFQDVSTTIRENPGLFPDLPTSFSDWDNFGYAQWGGFLTNKSLGTLRGLSYIPEIAAFVNATSPECVTYTAEDAKFLLNGTYGMFNSVNIGAFFAIMSAPTIDVTALDTRWRLTPSKAACLFSYLQIIMIAQAINPDLNPAIAGSGLFVTRPVRDWLFTGEDTLLKFLGRNPSSSFKSNATISKENAITVHVRIYTGKNDLHHSLMPYNEGEMLTFWREPVRVTGYNGSQFLPYGYIDNAKEQQTYPLELFHPLINRSIPFQNKGKDEWDGVKVRYLTLSDDALASDTLNEANRPYYSQYSGAINKTSNPPGLPIFLTTPNFNSADEVFYQNISFTDTLFSDYKKDVPLSRHRLSLFVLVEPTLGSTVWGNLPIQVNLKYPSSRAYPNVVPAYAPVYWNAIGDIATPEDLKTVKTDLYANQRAWKVLIGVGAGVGAALIVAGIVMIHHFKKHENELKDIAMNESK